MTSSGVGGRIRIQGAGPVRILRGRFWVMGYEVIKIVFLGVCNGGNGGYNGRRWNCRLFLSLKGNMLAGLKRVLLPVLAVMLVCSAVGAQTWRLEKGQGLKKVAGSDGAGYRAAVAEIKRLVDGGQADEAAKAIAKLKESYPQVTGEDVEAYFEAELLFAEGKLYKAATGFDKFLEKWPESELYEAVLERQFSIGTAYLGGAKRRVLKVFKIRGYATGEKIMEKIADRAGDMPIAIRAERAVAGSFEERGKYNEAYEKWSSISSKWATGQVGKDALLGMARCKYSAYNGLGYDGSCLISARSYYEDYAKRYPRDAKEIGVAEIVANIDEQLAYSQYSVGRYYERTGSAGPAKLYYQMVVDDWPGSKAAQAAGERGK